MVPLGLGFQVLGSGFGFGALGYIPQTVASTLQRSGKGPQQRWKIYVGAKVTPNVVTLSAALNACERSSRWQLALRVFDRRYPKPQNA